jgi:F-type H+-transporting ATPase subunit gamma
VASIRDLRVRIKSVGNIKQITRAMEMVATTKLRRFQGRAVASRPYAQEIAQLLARLAAGAGDELADRPSFAPGAGNAVAVLLITSERGLCGSYNSNIYTALERWLAAHHGTGRALGEAFASGDYKEVVMLYSAFESMAKYIPTITTLLPVQKSAAGSAEAAPKDVSNVILEPDAVTLLDKLVPRYLETRVYNALLESITSEYASRRMSMKNATDAASTMQSELKSVYNRKRQEGITKDLLDIVGAAEALR